MGIKEEITKIAVEQGYEGAKPKSIAQAIDALTDTLAGEDVKSGRSVVCAVKALAPYIGGGGGFVPKGMNQIKISADILGTGPVGFKAGTNEPSTDGPVIMLNANVCHVNDVTSIHLCGGLNVLATVPLASAVDADSLGVFLISEMDVSAEVPSTKKVLTPPSGDRVLFIAFTTPEFEGEGSNDLYIETGGGGIS